jgi:hypothetical protein
MNERIAKLANESGFDVDKTGTFGDYSVMHRVEKFAELIIQECISKLDEEIYRSIDGDGDEAWHDLILKEHFGVE